MQNGWELIFPFGRLETPFESIDPSSQRRDNCTLLVKAMPKIPFSLSTFRSLDLNKQMFRKLCHSGLKETPRNVRDTSLTTRDSSSHSGLENGTVLRTPDIRLSVYSIIYKSIILYWTRKKTTYVEPGQGIDRVVYGSGRSWHMRRMIPKVIPVETTASVYWDSQKMIFG